MLKRISVIIALTLISVSSLFTPTLDAAENNVNNEQYERNGNYVQAQKETRSSSANGSMTKRFQFNVGWDDYCMAELGGTGTINKLEAHFVNKGSYDQLYARAQSYTSDYVKAYSRNGAGEAKMGSSVHNSGNYSYASQGAARGTDIAALYR